MSRNGQIYESKEEQSGKGSLKEVYGFFGFFFFW